MVKRIAANPTDSLDVELPSSKEPVDLRGNIPVFTSFRLEVPHTERRALLDLVSPNSPNVRVIGGGFKGKRWTVVDVDKHIPITIALVKKWAQRKLGVDDVIVGNGSLIWNDPAYPPDEQAMHSDDFVDEAGNFRRGKFSVMVVLADFPWTFDTAFIDVLCKEQASSTDVLTVRRGLARDEAVVFNCLHNGAPGREGIMSPRLHLYIGDVPNNDQFGSNYLSSRLRTGLTTEVVLDKMLPLASIVGPGKRRAYNLPVPENCESKRAKMIE
jgi:hypothetical protein